jgi:hypothetical protein
MNTCASRFAFALAIAAGLAPPALAEDVWIQNGFGTGRDFMNMTEI